MPETHVSAPGLREADTWCDPQIWPSHRVAAFDPRRSRSRPWPSGSSNGAMQRSSPPGPRAVLRWNRRPGSQEPAGSTSDSCKPVAAPRGLSGNNSHSAPPPHSCSTDSRCCADRPAVPGRPALVGAVPPRRASRVRRVRCRRTAASGRPADPPGRRTRTAPWRSHGRYRRATAWPRHGYGGAAHRRGAADVRRVRCGAAAVRGPPRPGAPAAGLCAPGPRRSSGTSSYSAQWSTAAAVTQPAYTAIRVSAVAWPVRWPLPVRSLSSSLDSSSLAGSASRSAASHGPASPADGSPLVTCQRGPCGRGVQAGDVLSLTTAGGRRRWGSR